MQFLATGSDSRGKYMCVIHAYFSIGNCRLSKSPMSLSLVKDKLYPDTEQTIVQ